MTNGAFPPNSSCTFLTSLAQLAKIILPTGVEPVNETFLTVGCWQIALPTIGVFALDVVRTFMHPAGNPAFSASLFSTIQ
jgi:hypothetical protein